MSPTSTALQADGEAAGAGGRRAAVTEAISRRNTEQLARRLATDGGQPASGRVPPAAPRGRPTVVDRR
ncbi:hypothetical protein E4P41_18920 [Geodermatophilus sp. DF01-2]|uniref:hypothetical protein n=1 Tax=Geodermatophilus sp. DF01-2 TaxID=2559610 RepID=UPI00107470F3|nr:hypothetical protein [Geodermatophilus sp. DF01_2]TFV54446.1 hypothetical protein E4P41_18920 [Geodermatophilus sp. DF01_2]